jgi:hypothetical protein
MKKENIFFNKTQKMCRKYAYSFHFHAWIISWSFNFLQYFFSAYSLDTNHLILSYLFLPASIFMIKVSDFFFALRKNKCLPLMFCAKQRSFYHENEHDKKKVVWIKVK